MHCLCALCTLHNHFIAMKLSNVVMVIHLFYSLDGLCLGVGENLPINVNTLRTGDANLRHLHFALQL
jgi:hypothetical protein